MNFFEILKNNKEYSFEEINTFNNGKYPCFYLEKEFGFVVFFKCSDDINDFSVYDLKKNLITLIPNIDLSIQGDDWKKVFVYENIVDNSLFKDLIKKNQKKKN